MPKSTDTTVINIYLVTYRLSVFTSKYSYVYRESVRCIANDQYLAMSRVNAWALSTSYIWKDNQDFKLPIGYRELAILGVETYTENVGALLELTPLPRVFQNA